MIAAARKIARTLVIPVLWFGFGGVFVAHGAVAPVTVANNSGGGTSYRNALATAGSKVVAVNLGHTGPDIIANGITFVSTPGANPSGAGWSVFGPAVDDGLGNAGLDDLFFSEIWGGNPVRLTFGGLDPARRYLVQFLHGEPRGCCRGTYSGNTFSTDVDAAVVVPVFTIGNNLNAENPPATNDVALVTTRVSGVTGFTYNVYPTDTRGAAFAGFQVRDLGALLPVTSTADSGPGSLREAITYGMSGDVITFAAALSGQTIDLTSGELLMDQDLSLDASNLPGGLTIDAGGRSRVLRINHGTTVTLDSLGLTGGRTPRAVQIGASAEPGGGIHNEGDLIIRNTTIFGNATGRGYEGSSSFPAGNGGNGGGVFNRGHLTIENTTISGNSTGDGGSSEMNAGNGGFGGGIFNSGTVTLVHATISNNSTGAFGTGFGGFPGTSLGGGVYQGLGAELFLTNSILAGNTVPVGVDDLEDLGGAIVESGNNFTSGDPMLAPLGDYDGPTKTMPPLPGSPVIGSADAGGLLGTDQRGIPRPSGLEGDLGAVEILLPTRSPGDGDSEVGLLPVLTWSGPPGASYRVFVDSGFGLQSIGVTNATSITLPGGFALNTAYSWRIDVTLGDVTFTGDPSSFSTRDAIVVSTELDEDNGGLGKGVGDSLREVIAYAPGGGNLIRFDPSLDGERIVLTGGELEIDGEWLRIDASDLEEGLTIDAEGNSRVFLTDGTVVLDTLWITGGDGTDGGAIYNRGGTLELRNTTVSGSTALRGGGIFNAGTLLSLTHCTLGGNSADQSGGGIHATGGRVALADTTVSGNSALSGGGLFMSGGSVIALENTIVAGNDAPASPDIDAASGLTLSGGNIVGRSAGNSAAGPGVITGVNARLGALGDYRGPTPTMPLLAGSPAIDAGQHMPHTPLFDQRGNPRVLAGGLDIGAFESGVTGLSPDGGRLHAKPGGSPDTALLPGKFEISLDPGFQPGAKSVSRVWAGSGLQGGDDGGATRASFNYPFGLASDAEGTLYVADTANHSIRSISIDGTVVTVAGGQGFGLENGPGGIAKFAFPSGIAIGPGGVLYVSDTLNHCIRKLVPPSGGSDWLVTTFAGAGSQGFRDSIGGAALFHNPGGLAVDAAGNVFVADTLNHRIRRISPSGMVSTFAGSGSAGWHDANGGDAQFREPADVDVDASGNVFVADQGNHCIRRITPAGDVTTVAGSNHPGLVDDTGGAARFDGPAGIAVLDGRLLVTDQNNHVLRLVSESTVGSGTWQAVTFSGDGIDQPMEFPSGVTTDALGRIYLTDAANHQIRRIGRSFITVDASLDADSGEVVADLDVAAEGLDAGQQFYFRWVTEAGNPDSVVQVLPLPSPVNLDDFADPDFDGIINLLEEAYGLDPFVSSQEGSPSIDHASGTPRLTFRSSLTANGISMTPEWSLDLQNWSSTGTTEEVLSDDGSVQSIRASFPPPPGGRIFLRLHVSRN